MKIKKEFYLISRTDGISGATPYTEEVFPKGSRYADFVPLIEAHLKVHVMKTGEPFTVDVDVDNYTFTLTCDVSERREKTIRKALNDMWIEGGTGKYDNAWHTNFIITNKKYAKVEKRRTIDFNTYFNYYVEEIEKRDIVFADASDIYKFMKDVSVGISNKLYKMKANVSDTWYDDVEKRLIDDLGPRDKSSVAIRLVYKVINGLDNLPNSFNTFYNKYYLPAAREYPILCANFNNRGYGFYAGSWGYDNSMDMLPKIDDKLELEIMDKFLAVKSAVHFLKKK